MSDKFTKIKLNQGVAPQNRPHSFQGKQPMDKRHEFFIEENYLFSLNGKLLNSSKSVNSLTFGEVTPKQKRKMNFRKIIENLQINSYKKSNPNSEKPSIFEYFKQQTALNFFQQISQILIKYNIDVENIENLEEVNAFLVSYISDIKDKFTQLKNSDAIMTK